MNTLFATQSTHNNIFHDQWETGWLQIKRDAIRWLDKNITDYTVRNWYLLQLKNDYALKMGIVLDDPPLRLTDTEDTLI